jgi:hypothetical protein
LNPEAIKITIEIKLKVSFYGIKISIPTKYTATLKELVKPKA